jgi:ABC-2 type transport system permease protein
MNGRTAIAAEVSSPLSNELRRIQAYAKKEFLIEASYRFALLFWIFGIFTTIATYFFIDRLFGRQITPELAPFGAPYFAYVLVGNAFFAYVGTAIGGLSGRIGAEQSLGTLEVLLGTPTRLWVLILAIAIWNTAYASVEVVLYFLVGGVGFGVDFSQINWASLSAMLGLVILVFNSVGLAEAGCLILFKRGAVGAWVLNGISAVLGGVFFPVTVLPEWLRWVAELNPITHAIRGLQLAIFQGAPVAVVGRELAVLTLFAVLLVPLGLITWRWALRRARVEGSLCLH